MEVYIFLCQNSLIPTVTFTLFVLFYITLELRLSRLRLIELRLSDY